LHVAADIAPSSKFGAQLLLRTSQLEKLKGTSRSRIVIETTKQVTWQFEAIKAPAAA